MIKLKINRNFRSLIVDLLSNSNKLQNVFYINNDVLVINKQDLEVVDKVLSKNYYKYKLI
jgi:hypothetical protein